VTAAAGRPDGPRSIRLVASIWLAAGLVATALSLQLVDGLPGAPPLPQRLGAVLVAMAGLCVAGLTVRRAAPVAWAATAGAAGIAAVVVLGLARGWQPLLGVAAWPWLAAVGALALIAAGAITAAYAAAPRSGGAHSTAIGAVVAIGLLALIGSAVWAVATALSDAAGAADAPDLWPIRAATRMAFVAVGVFGLIGAGRDFAAPLGRATARQAAAGDPGAGALFRLVIDELMPGGSASRRRGVEEERARIAADIHALVLPDLRRAAAAAEAPGLPASVAAGIRSALGDVEGLMHARQSVVLEEYGLVAALEWLAERTEERSDIQVAIDLESDVGDPATPIGVQRAAFRVGLLALDNVVRHSRASHATIRLSTGEGRLDLAIADDGSGLDAGRSTAGRGLADMRSEAAAIGATLSVNREDGESGQETRVRLTWPSSLRSGPTSPGTTSRPS
jgi:signal transduction histidine kinase